MIGQIRSSMTIRIALGVVSVTVGLLLTAALIGFLPDRAEIKIEGRKKAVELIAVQVASAAARNDIPMVQTILSAAVERDDTIQSAALRGRAGILAIAGDHDNVWEPPEEGFSTSTHVQVPIMRDSNEWGAVEISFEPLNSGFSLTALRDSPLTLLAFVSTAGFLLYFLFLRRVLRELDPSRVVPEHVRSAFDALAEGVIIIDDEERIVLANEEFAKMIGRPAELLTGLIASELDWLASQNAESSVDYPWQAAMREGIAHTGVSLRRHASDEEARVYVVNGAPILDGKGRIRGALATFDDVSDLEKKNEELEYAMTHLSKSKEEVKRQNKELRYLATRDPLTGLLNRRALFERFEKLLMIAKDKDLPLSAIMMDIDHFKSINDKYGHSAGDKVIKFVARKLKAVAKGEDLAARYGGEEFCLILPRLSLEEAAALAEQIRKSVQEDFDEHFSSSIELTISLGVASMEGPVDSTTDILNCADQALYVAKENGRNRVIKTDDPEFDSTAQVGINAEGASGADKTMLVQKIEDTQTTMKLTALSDRIVELDTMIEEKSATLHRKHGFDELTGLPNRILFYDRLTQALAGAQREGQIVAMLYVDVDLLRRDGDELESTVGDNLLSAVSKRLSSVIRSSDSATLFGKDKDSVTVSRLGRNEFGIAVNDLVNTEAATWATQRIFESMATPISVDEDEIYANVSIGISLYPSDGEDAESLVRSASVARHHAQAARGHNQFRFFSDDMNERSFEQMKLQNQLQEAFEAEQFELYYQPEVDVDTEQTVALEALIRWNHPEMGLIGAEMFIPLAEQSGIINKIGAWVLRAACLQMRKWLDAGSEDVHVAVNLSAQQMQSDTLVDEVLSALSGAALAPEYLELEVTETSLIKNVGKIDDVLKRLRSEGVKVSIDDFGTGYSSLSHLRTFEVDALKIDRTFIRDVTSDETDAALVGAIIGMAQSMQLRVVAEGVESKEQLDFLRDHNCDVAQGYLLSHPVTAEDAGVWLGCRTGLFPALKPLEEDISGTAETIVDESQDWADVPAETEAAKTADQV